MIENIKWLGHASFKILGKRVIFIDPWKLQGDHEKADLILVTHSHFDHLSPEDIQKIQKEETVIVAPPDCLSKLSGNVKAARPDDQFKLQGVEVAVVPAYNTNKDFHPKKKGWVGYIITIEGTRIYHAGDTDLIPEMEGLKADIAILPVSGTYVMTAQEAAEAVKKIHPQIAIPMHHNSIVGSMEDAESFQYLVEGVDVRLL